jgi:pimeloyl-ACP methyl ester carboxylesterase
VSVAEESMPAVVERSVPGTPSAATWRAAYELVVNALNGAFGDDLHTRGSGLAIDMAFYHRHRPLELDARSVAAAFPEATPKLCILVHGLGMNERCWSFRDDPTLDYGRLLQHELGYTPVYVRYNTGLHVSANGRRLATLIADLINAYPCAVEELTLIGHSMGGLVLRSACHYAATATGSTWLGRHVRLFTLGTPHQGAPLEKLANAVASLLRSIPHPTAQIPADFVNARSTGVKDLRYGYTRDEDWDARDPDAFLFDNRRPDHALGGAMHYALAGTLTRDPTHWVTWVLGDALVRVSSAHGECRDAARRLPLAPEQRAVVGGVGHNALAHSPAVYAEIRRWCARRYLTSA